MRHAILRRPAAADRHHALAYLDEMGARDLAGLDVRDVSGFLLRQRHLRRKTVAAMRSCLADFLSFLSVTGRTPTCLANRLPRHRHVRHESEPHLWTVDEIRRLLAGIDRESATGKRVTFAMILTAARLGLRISDLRHLELSDFGLEGEDDHDCSAQDGPAALSSAARRRRLGDHRLHPARPPRDGLPQGVRQAPPPVRYVRLRLVDRVSAVKARRPRGDRRSLRTRSAGCIRCAARWLWP